MLFQLPENFEDMAMYISQEWGHQDPSKRALSRDMVQDSYENVGTLGKNFSFWNDGIYDQSVLLLRTHIPSVHELLVLSRDTPHTESFSY